MNRFLAMALTTLFTTSAFAGATNAIFECVSGSGRTTLTASVPGDFAEHSVTLTIDGKVAEYFDTIEQTPPYLSIRNSDVAVTGDMQKKDYSFLITQQESPSAVLLSFTAIPKSIKVKSVSGGERGSLRAIIQGVDPRDKSLVTKPIEVKCTYEYTI
ncbi:hypothetical protein [Bdellovibrio sp. HCB337]|uniref:hypothetical protein n=1 Tax=Bdellovibrio sp. HCB337 TaxID=3394358 RepID=UPI0039A73B57